MFSELPLSNVLSLDNFWRVGYEDWVLVNVLS